jgi:hypothetical protein
VLCECPSAVLQLALIVLWTEAASNITPRSTLNTILHDKQKINTNLTDTWLKPEEVCGVFALLN